jgi:hypothetical protein
MLQSPVFSGGSGRSGTTLLRVILDTRTRIACGPELKVLPVLARLSDDFRSGYALLLCAYHVDARDTERLFGQFVSGLIKPLRLAQGKARIAEKTPNNVFFPNCSGCFRKLVSFTSSAMVVTWLPAPCAWTGRRRKANLDLYKGATEAARCWAGAVRAWCSFAPVRQRWTIPGTSCSLRPS